MAISVHHKVHRVATATFWRTFHCDGKIGAGDSGGVYALPLSLYLPSPAKLWCTLQLRGQPHPPYFSPLHQHVLCGVHWEIRGFSRAKCYCVTPNMAEPKKLTKTFCLIPLTTAKHSIFSICSSVIVCWIVICLFFLNSPGAVDRLLGCAPDPPLLPPLQ